MHSSRRLLSNAFVTELIGLISFYRPALERETAQKAIAPIQSYKSKWINIFIFLFAVKLTTVNKSVQNPFVPRLK